MATKIVDIPAIMQVIGNIYLRPSLLDETDKYHFYPEDFTEDFHKVLFGAIYNLYQLGAAEITPITIEDYLEKYPKKLSVYQLNKGPEYLAQLTQNTQTAAFPYYYNRMKKMTLLRMYQSIGMDMRWIYDPDNIFDVKKKQAQEEYIDSVSLDDIADEINKRIDKIRLKYADVTEEGFIQGGEGVDELIQSLQDSPEIGAPLYGGIVNTITRGARLSKFYLRSAASGVGKAIPNYTLIPTPIGFKKVEEIKVGDYLIGQNGKPTKVLQVHPQPEQKEIWKVTFSDGRVAECCKDHLWEYRYETHRGKAYRVESLQDLYNRTLILKNGLRTADNKGYRFQIRMNAPVEYSEKQYSIEPYVMGALLGDGSFRYSNTNKALTFSSETDEIPKKIALLTHTTERKSSKFNYNWTFHADEKHNLWVEEILQAYPGLWNTKSETKFIPKDYLFGSIQQRYALLQGLMDTDGNIDEKGRTSFTTVSPQLRDDFIQLVRSLGMIATYLIGQREEKYTTGECYQIHIQCKKQDKDKMFSLARKVMIAQKYQQTKKREEYKDHLSITKIEKTSVLTDMTCFTVDNDSHLFLMNDFIVTHNTRQMIGDVCGFACDEMYDVTTNQWVNINIGEPTLFISTEQKIDEIQTMILAFLSGVNEERIIRGNYLAGELERVKHAAQILKRSPLYIKELPDFSLEDIENAIKFGVNTWNVKYICYDYIHTSMKILSEISSKAKVSGLREDNVLFMISVRLKDLCNEYDVFILSATQLNAGWQDADTYDQNLLRGAKSIADKIDVGMITLNITEKDIETLRPLCTKTGLPLPNYKMSVYKNRRGRWNNILVWGVADKGICRFNPYFVTDYNYELQDIEETIITYDT